MFIFLGWYINRPFLYEIHPDRKLIWPTKRWHTSSGSVDIEIDFKTLIDKHAALISANQCGALLFWLNYASFLSALIWTFWLSWRVTIQWTGGYFCLLDAGPYRYCTKGTCDFMKREGRKVKQGLTTHWQFSPRNCDLPPPGVDLWSTGALLNPVFMFLSRD